MPRFSNTEKENIKRRLLVEGERLFVAHGLKKVTIDELAEAVNIAKATFYKFYEGKEYLYLDIVQGIQRSIFTELDKLLDSNADLPGKTRVRQVFEKMTELMMKFPILMQIDAATMDIIARKVSNERMMMYFQQNLDAARSLYEHGVRFACEVKIASIIFQALYQCFINIKTDNHEERALSITLMLDGIIDKIVEE
jgi:AcrR family transcriptional regulator